MPSSQTIRVASVLVLSLGFSAPALAGGDASAGKHLSTACQACHVSDAADGNTPHLAGQRESYLARQLKAFKTGDRKSSVMHAITSELDDATIANLAAFWASQVAGSDTTLAPEIAAVKQSKMAFPRDFPKGFVLYDLVNRNDDGTVARRYINLIGLQAAKAGKPMPSGAVIVAANYTAKLGADQKPITDKDSKWEPDKLNGYDGMEARAGWSKGVPALLLNEPVPGVNWSYAQFTADKAPRTETNQAVCLACHRPAAKTSFVYGYARAQAKAKAIAKWRGRAMRRRRTRGSSATSASSRSRSATT